MRSNAIVLRPVGPSAACSALLMGKCGGSSTCRPACWRAWVGMLRALHHGVRPCHPAATEQAYMLG